MLDNAIKLPLLGVVRCKGLRKLDGKVSKATIRRTPSGKYFVSILYVVEADDPAPINGMIGLDVGIKSSLLTATMFTMKTPSTWANP